MVTVGLPAFFGVYYPLQATWSHNSLTTPVVDQGESNGRLYLSLQPHSPVADIVIYSDCQLTDHLNKAFLSLLPELDIVTPSSLMAIVLPPSSLLTVRVPCPPFHCCTLFYFWKSCFQCLQNACGSYSHSPAHCFRPKFEI